MKIISAVCYSFSLKGEDPMAHLRLIGPFKRSGINLINGIENNQINIDRVSEGDFVVIQRQFPEEFSSFERIMEIAHKYQKPVVFDWDDLLLFLPEDHPDRQSSYFGSALLPMFQALLEADLVSVATPKLRDVLAHYNDNVVVLPNYFDDELWHLTPPALKNSSHELLTIGYMGGNSHGPDLVYIEPVIQDLLKRHPQRIRFHFRGVRPPVGIATLPHVEWTPIKPCSYKDFSAFFQTQTADIFIAPLIDNLFNRCKSPIKFFEYSALGAAGVYSRLETYTDVVTQGQNGYLASSLDEWIECINQLIENDELRFHLATDAQATIREHWLLSENGFRWKEAFLKLLKNPSLIRQKNKDVLELVKSINPQLSSTISHKEETIQTLTEKEQVLTAQVTEKEHLVEGKIREVVEKEQQVMEKEQQLIEKEQQVAGLKRQLSEIAISKTWRVALMLRRMRIFLLPPGSLRLRLIRKILLLLFSPLSIRRDNKIQEDLSLVRNSGLFDPVIYLEDNPDVRHANVDPLMHFMFNGWKEGRNPGPLFDVKFYLENNADVKASGINPLVHYLRFGKKEGRLPRVDGRIGKIPHSDQKSLTDKNSINTNQKGEPFSPGYRVNSTNERESTLRIILDYYITYGMRALINKAIGKISSSIKSPFKNRKNKSAIQYYEKLYSAQSKNNKYVPYSDEYPYLFETDVKLIAFYLPQYHPIPENDEWWGKGFTEWTNVSKAIPNFIGHYQPRLPGELGFYDLRIPDVQKRQIELARKYGIYGFCFHYYWFNGRRLLERPLNQFLENSDMDFPFCLCWANENWTRRWDGLEDEILIAQTHSEDEYLAFIRDIIPHLLDKRYIRVNGKPLLIVYRASLLPNPQLAVEIWRSECKKMGIGEIYLVAAQSFGITDPRPYGFDAAVEFPPHNLWETQIDMKMVQVTNPNFKGRIFDYSKAIKLMKNMIVPNYTLFRTVMPAWDNTARKQNDGYAFINSTPSAYKLWLENTISYTKRVLPEINDLF